MLPLSAKPGYGSFARKDGPGHDVTPCAHPLDRRQAVATRTGDGNEFVAVVCVLCCTYQSATWVTP